MVYSDSLTCTYCIHSIFNPFCLLVLCEISGLHFGVIIAYPTCGNLASSYLGWELIYYILATMALSGTVVWTLLTASSPEDHPAVGDVEKEFICEALLCYKKVYLIFSLLLL